VQNVQHGQLNLAENGSFSYTAHRQFSTAAIAFTYKVERRHERRQPVTVSITVDAGQRSAGSRRRRLLDSEDTTLVVSITDGVLKNDTDADSDTLKAFLVDNVQHGQLSWRRNGPFTYTPARQFPWQ